MGWSLFYCMGDKQNGSIQNLNGLMKIKTAFCHLLVADVMMRFIRHMHLDTFNWK